MLQPSKSNTPQSELRDANFGLEGDMRAVKDWALILHDALSPAGPLGAEMRGALVQVTGELLRVGYRLDEEFDRLWSLVKSEGRP